MQSYNHLSGDDETSNVLKRSQKMFVYVLAICFALTLLKRSSHYVSTFYVVPWSIFFFCQKEQL